MTHTKEFNERRRFQYAQARRLGLVPREAGHVYSEQDFARKRNQLLDRPITTPVNISRRRGVVRATPQTVGAGPDQRQAERDANLQAAHDRGERWPGGRLKDVGTYAVGYTYGHHYVLVRIRTRDEDGNLLPPELVTVVLKDKETPTYRQIEESVSRIRQRNAKNYPETFIGLDILEDKFFPDIEPHQINIVPPAFQNRLK